MGLQARTLFVTGALRSGTTLLDKLLSSDPEVRVFSQPLPLLYVETKRSFLVSGLRAVQPTPEERHYPLSDMFGRHYYPPGDLEAFLERFELGRDFCRTVLERMLSYSGQKIRAREPFGVLEGFDRCGLSEFIERYLMTLGDVASLRVLGSKETVCEEFIPYFLARGTRVLQIVRDPRDIIASLNFGRGERWGGRRRPHLFNIRQWRKSVAFALAHRDHPRFLAIRYETLVERPKATLERLGAFLGLEEFAAGTLDGPLRVPAGEVWLSNSSFARATGVHARSVGRYRELLARELDLFVQATCFWEFRRLGLGLDIDVSDILPLLERLRPAEELERPELASYLWSRERLAEECARAESLLAGEFEAPLFIFEEAYNQLRSVVPVPLES